MTSRTRSERVKEFRGLRDAVKTVSSALKTLQRLEMMPMSYILSKVPGGTAIERAEAVGVSRQTYYFWLQGRSRPSQPQAEKIAELTGIPVEEIMSIEELDGLSL